MSEYWFKPRSYGYGATPIHWKGWVASIGFLMALAAASFGLLSSGVARPTTGQILLWAVLVGIATSMFIKFCKSRTRGEWRWRWGAKSP
jgi:prolipoprotein diacylglyceryltransferase